MRSAQDRGFVLPYVLVVIAILAMAGTIAAQRLQKATQIVSEMQDRAAVERVLISAEAAATYSLLTGNTVMGGYDLSPQSPIVSEFGLLSSNGRQLLREDQVGSTVKDIWLGNGSLRRYSIEQNKGTTAQALVAFRDASGLVSLNSINPSLLLPLLEATGATPQEARVLIAALIDYTDPDNTRRQYGAESFDYEIRELPPPPNAPLRSYEELGSVLGWREVIPRLDFKALKDMTTLQLNVGYRQAFSSKSLIDVIGLNNKAILPDRNIDIIEAIELNNKQPSQAARFTIWARRNDGRYQKRVVEVERFLGSIGDPYRRYWVYDSVVLESDLVINADLSARRQNEPLQFDEFDHVVHASALRP